jgi:hypothetical protein
MLEPSMSRFRECFQLKKTINSRQQHKSILIQEDKEEEKHVESNDRKQLKLFDVTILTMNFNNIQEIMVYLIEKLNQKPIILTFSQFDHLVILDKSI